MHDGATIVACATGTGPSARALVRVSGPACGEIERLLLARPAAARSPLAARLRLTERLDLPCLAWIAKGPRTFTGEDTLELLVPGNPLVVQRVIVRLCETLSGGVVRTAEPGEFSARAYLNGKMSLERAEGVAAIIAAESGSQLEAAARLMSGATGSVYRSWAEEAATLLALVEAGIDFSDQEGVVGIQPELLRGRVEGLRRAIGDYLGSATGREAPSGRPRVALVGPPNAGKSTLFNALLGRTRAVATPIAGTTRDVLTEPLTLRAADDQGIEIDLIDLPGLDRLATGLDALGQAAAGAAIAEADVVVLCCDAGRFVEAPARAAPVVRVHTKTDRPGKVEGADVAVCALTGSGLDRLRRLVVEAVGGPRGREAGADTVVPWHARALRAALGSLASVDGDGPAEVAAHHLRAALDSLGEVSGAVTPDDVIGLVFARFCVGK